MKHTFYAEVNNLKAIQKIPRLRGTGKFITVFTIQIRRENFSFLN